MDLDNNSKDEPTQKELTDAERDPSYFNYYAQLTHQVINIILIYKYNIILYFLSFFLSIFLSFFLFPFFF